MTDAKPIVGVVMGSESDLEIMQRCMKLLDELEIAHEVRIISAHRTPAAANEYATTAADRGLRVIIGAAGLSAALPGVLAANTRLPVIGVPIDAGSLAGVDAVLSIIQMPPGVPVGCMALGKAGAANAAVYAAEILALGDAGIAARLEKFKLSQAEKVKQQDDKVRKDS